MNAGSEPNLRNPLSVHAVLKDDSASLAKDRYGTAALSSVDQFELANCATETMPGGTDEQDATVSIRYSHNEAFSSITERPRTTPEQLR